MLLFSYCVFETFEYACDESGGVQVSIEDAGVSNKHEQKEDEEEEE